MKKLMISLSVAVFALAMMANIQYALDGYGVDNSNLHAQVLAQSTGTGGTTNGGGSTGGSGTSTSKPFCYAGGIGSSQCSIDAGVTILNYGVSGGCSVTCTRGYSCCTLRCYCVI